MSTTPSVEKLIADELGVDVGRVTPGANLVTDLQATPEDFLGIQFTLRRQLGVNLSLNEISSTLLDGAPASWWRHALQQGYVDDLPDHVRATADDTPVRGRQSDLAGEPCSVERLLSLVSARTKETMQPV